MRAAASPCSTGLPSRGARASATRWGTRNISGYSLGRRRARSHLCMICALADARPRPPGANSERQAQRAYTTRHASIAETCTTAAETHLIELLPRDDRRHLLAICEPVDLALSEVLYETGKRTRSVYFPIDATISLVTPIDGKPALEVGMVGREGMVGAQVVLGVMTTPLHAVVQGAGRAWSVATVPFRRELARSTALRHCLDRYLYVLLSQFAVSAACLRYHLIGPRLARWLLMTHDRAHANHFHVTHEFLADMLGVRRSGVSIAAGALQLRKLIGYSRGEIRILNRKGLEAASCECYDAIQEDYANVLG